MAATIVVEDGTGLSTANSYVSAADANTHLEELYLLMGLIAAPTVTDIGCISGTLYLDSMYGGRWRGTRTNDEQALDWPRAYAAEDDGYSWDSDEIPTVLEQAAALAAYYAINDKANLIPDQADSGSVKRVKKRVGPIEKETEYLGSSSPQKKYTLIEKYMRVLIESSSMAVRGS